MHFVCDLPPVSTPSYVIFSAGFSLQLSSSTSHLIFHFPPQFSFPINPNTKSISSQHKFTLPFQLTRFFFCVRSVEGLNLIELGIQMVDCRSLIEFCRAYEQHKNIIKFNSHINKKNSYNNQKNSFCCDHSPFAVSLDAFILLLVLGSLGFLLIPYFKLIFTQISPIIVEVLIELINNSPVAYFVGLFVALIGVIILIVIWEIIDLRSRKCENPNCQGLRRAVEFDIQLESEDCIKCLPSDRDLNSSSFYDYGVKPLELGEERKELEAELKRMAPRNGRTVLIFRAPCGCPAGRLEVWGNKKIRRIKK